MKRAWNRLVGRSGFTLIELIIVIIIIGVLAAIALPQYTAFVERARGAEAVSAIGSIKIAEETFRMENTASSYTAVLGALPVTPSTVLWTYAVTTPVNATIAFTATATRAAGGPNAGGTIIFNYDRTGNYNWDGTHPGKPKT